jgi:hypothetical protein
MLMTQLPPPISLDQANITKILPINTTIINPVDGYLINIQVPTFTITTSNVLTQLPVDGYTTNQTIGRNIKITIAGNNANFPTSIIINGKLINSTISETIIFSNYGSLSSVNKYTYISI